MPSRVGRMLVSGRTDFIGMVLPVRDGHLMDSFLGEFVAGLSEGLTVRGRDLFIATAPRLHGEADVVRHIIAGDRADAIVLNRTEIDDERVRVLVNRQFPFVAHGRLLTGANDFPWFDTDGEAAFAQATRMLLDLGHRRFGLVTINEPFTFAHLRRRGLEKALAEAGLELPARRGALGADGGRGGGRGGGAVSSCRATTRPTAIFGVTDTQAIAVLKAAAARSIPVPAGAFGDRLRRSADRRLCPAGALHLRPACPRERRHHRRHGDRHARQGAGERDVAPHPAGIRAARQPRPGAAVIRKGRFPDHRT